MDISDLQGLLGQLQPSQEDKDAARRAAIMQFGLGLFGTRKGEEFQRYGQSGMGAAATYQDSLKNSRTERQANLTQAAALQEMMRKQQFADQMTPPPDGPQAPQSLPAGAVGGTGMGGGTPSLFGPSAQPGPVASSAPPPLPQKQNVWMQLKALGVPDVAIRAAATSKDPAAEAQKLAMEFGKPQQMSPGNTLYNADGSIRIQAPNIDKGMQMGADGNVSTLPGYANATGQIAGATAGAQEAAKAKLDMISVPNGKGGTVMLPRDMAVDRARQTPFGPPSAGGLSFGEAPSPASVAATGDASRDFITNSYRPVVDAMKASRKGLADLDMMQRMDITGKTGWGTSAKVTGARVLQGLGVAPDAARQYASEAEIFNRQLGENVWGLLGQQKGVQSEGDAARAKKVFANLENTPQANAYMIDMARAMHNLNIKQGEFYTKNYTEALKSGDPSQLEAKWAQNAPSIWDDPAMKKWQNYAGGKPGASQGEVMPTTAAKGNPTVMTILKSNPTPAQIEALRAKGYIQ